MAAILTAEDVVRRIAAECTYVDERGGVGIRPFSGGLPPRGLSRRDITRIARHMDRWRAVRMRPARQSTATTSCAAS